MMAIMNYERSRRRTIPGRKITGMQTTLRSSEEEEAALSSTVAYDRLEPGEPGASLTSSSSSSPPSPARAVLGVKWIVAMTPYEAHAP